MELPDVPLFRGLTADEAAAMLADPLMVLVNHTNKMPDDYTIETKECGSKTAVNTVSSVSAPRYASTVPAPSARRYPSPSSPEL